MSSRFRSVCGVAGSHGIGALQDHGAGAGGGRPAAQAASVPAEGGRCVPVPAADQQPQGPGPVPGEKGLWYLTSWFLQPAETLLVKWIFIMFYGLI